MGRRTQLASALACLLLAGCGITERRVREGDGSSVSGGAGRPASNGGANSTAGGSAATAPNDGGAGSAETTLVIDVHGLPAAVAPVFSVTFARDAKLQVSFDQPGRYTGVLPGEYLLRTVPLFGGGATVRTLLLASAGDRSTFELHAGETYTLQLDYAPVPTSGKLWRSSSDHASAVGLPSATFDRIFDPVPAVVVAATVGASLAFDRQGNLWTLGPTVADSHLLRYRAKALDGDSPSAKPDISIELMDVDCYPAVNDLVFDAAGGLWLSVCGDQLCKLEAESLLTSGGKSCDQVLPGPVGGNRVAFDQHGDLHIAAGASLERIPRQTVANPAYDEPHTSLTISTPSGDALEPHALAFDRDGNLWAIDTSSGILFEVAVDDLGKNGNVVAQALAQFGRTTSAALAFDNLGWLWLGLEDGQLARLTSEALLHLPAPPALADTDMTFTNVPTTGPLVFFPAPAGLPLYHSLSPEAAP
jgi:sugar lactone lactonase YvrE